MTHYNDVLLQKNIGQQQRCNRDIAVWLLSILFLLIVLCVLFFAFIINPNINIQLTKPEQLIIRETIILLCGLVLFICLFIFVSYEAMRLCWLERKKVKVEINQLKNEDYFFWLTFQAPAEEVYRQAINREYATITPLGTDDCQITIAVEKIIAAVRYPYFAGLLIATIVNILTCSPTYHPSDEKRETLINKISNSLENLGDWAITVCVVAGIHKKNSELADRIKAIGIKAIG